MTKREATKLANELKKKLNGKGWSIRVWENLGWYYSVVNTKGNLEVYPSHSAIDDDVRYWCRLQPSYTFWCSNCTNFKDPNQAVQVELEHANKVVQGFVNILEAGNNVLCS